MKGLERLQTLLLTLSYFKHFKTIRR